MTKFKIFYLKNAMLVANFLANFIGVFLANAMLRVAEGFPDKPMWQNPLPYWIDTLFAPASPKIFAFSFVAVMTVLYEIPIRRYLDLSSQRVSISQDLETKARQRLLNEPFALMGFGFSMWLLAAIYYSIIHWAYGSG